MRVSCFWRSVSLAATMAAVGCSGSSTQPSAPSPPASPAVNVLSVTVSGAAPTLGASSQLTATAAMSNGTSQNVTGQATWVSSSAAIATVTATGLLTAVSAGAVDVSATYQNVVGFSRLSIARPPAYTLGGTVTDGTSGGVLPKIALRIADGANAGKTATTDAEGRYAISDLSAGTFTLSASAASYQTASKTVVVSADTHFDLILQRTAATPAPAPTPTPTPTPAPPTPSPVPSSGFYVWGGQNYTQYLGFFTCVFCQEFASDSINNQFGPYGSQFSSTSIRNQFSPYGSQFSSISACNQFAANPPRVYNSNRSTYYGELTINQFRSDAIKTASILSWLTGELCRH